MTRKEYIEKLDEVRDALLHIGADFKSSTITDENEIEEKRRKVVEGLFDKLDTILFENGAVSMRIREENLANGVGEQGDLFEAHPDGEVDFPTAGEETKAFPDDIEESAEAAPTNPPTDITKVETDFTTKKVGVCKYCAKGSGEGGCDICVLEPNYGKRCDGLDVECENHAEKAKKARKTKGVK